MEQFDNTTPHLSSLYDSQILNTIPNYDCFHKAVTDLVSAAGIIPRIWLDTGAGTGTLIKSCSRLFPDTLFLLADPSVEMLKEAKHKLFGYGENRIRFLDPAGTQDISLPAGLQPDIITAIQCHHYLSREARKSASEMCFNTLHQGGLYITFENIRPFTERGTKIGKKYWGNYQLNRGKNEEQVKKHLERFDSEYFPINIEEHLKLYRECGFETVELLWYSCMQAGFYCIK